jgi:hypothetical protein
MPMRGSIRDRNETPEQYRPPDAACCGAADGWRCGRALGERLSGSGDSRVATAVVTHVQGLPPGVTQPPDAAAAGIPKPFATWAASHEMYVTTWGSSSCPRLPTSVHAKGAHGAQINTAEHYLHKGDNACTSDLAATTSTVRLPLEIDDTAALAVTIDGTLTELGSRVR